MLIPEHFSLLQRLFTLSLQYQIQYFLQVTEANLHLPNKSTLLELIPDLVDINFVEPLTLFLLLFKVIRWG